MKYFSRSGVYKNSTGSNVFDPNTQKGVSYEWWVYSRVIGDSLVLNNFHYSTSTAKHISAASSIMTTPDIVVECPKGLQSVDGLMSGKELYRERIEELLDKITKKGSRSSTNEKRIEAIMLYKRKIRTLNMLIRTLKEGLS